MGTRWLAGSVQITSWTFGAGAAALGALRVGQLAAARAYVVLPPAPPGWLGYNIGGGIGAFRLAAIGVAAAHVGLSHAPERLVCEPPRGTARMGTLMAAEEC